MCLHQHCQACPCFSLGAKEGKEQEDNTDGVKESSVETVSSLLWGFTCVAYQNRYSLQDTRGLWYHKGTTQILTEQRLSLTSRLYVKPLCMPCIALVEDPTTAEHNLLLA